MIEHFAIYESKVGFIQINYQADFVTAIQMIEDEVMDCGMKTPLSDEVFSQLIEYFDGKRKTFEVRCKPSGTAFQKSVWTALADIPYGETRSYKEVAALIGNEKASRAIGMANHKNPLLFIVPCHRVIGTNGELVGYAGGLELKKFLLNLEEENK